MEYSETSPVAKGIIHLLDHLKVRYSRNKLLALLYNHPDFPNPSSIIDCLVDLKLKAEAVEGQVHQIDGVELPGLALNFDDANEPYYQLVLAADDITITTVDHSGKECKVKHEDFSNVWSGVFVLINNDRDSGDPEYDHHKKKEVLNTLVTGLTWIFAIVFVTATFFASYTRGISLTGTAFSYLAIKLIGLYISAQLVKMDLFNIKSGLLSDVCHEGKVNDCSAVLSSQAGKLFGIIGLSEIGLMYFSGGSFLILISFLVASEGTSISVLGFIGVLSLLAIPFTIYSIVQQAFIIKKFCTLCLVIQGLLWSEAALTVLSQQNLVPSTQWLQFALLFSVPGLVWLYIREPLSEYKRLSQSETKNKWSRLDINAFNRVLQSGENKLLVPDELGLIKLGNPEGNVKVAMISDATCHACGNAYLELEYLLRQYPEDIDLKILFVSPQQEIGIATKWLSFFMKNPSEISTLIHDWYFAIKERGLTKANSAEIKKLYELWLNKFGLSENGIDGEAAGLTNRNNAWYKQNNIQAYPTLIVNGTKLPISYHAHDLKFFISELTSA